MDSDDNIIQKEKIEISPKILILHLIKLFIKIKKQIKIKNKI